MVLKHKHCLLYPRLAFQYGCHCGVAPNKADCGSGGTVDCLDSCCRLHNECFGGLGSNCTGLEAYKWRWDEKVLKRIQGFKNYSAIFCSISMEA